MSFRLRPAIGLSILSLRSLAPLLIACGLIAIALTAAPTSRRRHRHSLLMLKRTILGCAKRSVIEALGPPRIAMVRGQIDNETLPHLQADTWYYALEERDRSAIAVTFDHDVVKDVEFFRSGLTRFSTTP